MFVIIRKKNKIVIKNNANVLSVPTITTTTTTTTNNWDIIFLVNFTILHPNFNVLL